jgi:toxin FitB
MSFLWDTCVLSDLSKSSRVPAVVEFLATIPTEQTFISVITVGEIEYGLRRLPIGRRRAELEAVMNEILDEFSPRILPIDAEVARVWGEIAANARQRGFNLDVADAQIAATALYHGLQVVTRNVKDFEPAGVRIVNPWKTQG